MGGWLLSVTLIHLAVTIGALGMAVWLAGSRRARGHVTSATIPALLVTAAWSLAVALAGYQHVFSTCLGALANLAWLWLLYRLFGRDDRDKNVAPVRPVVLALGLVGLLRLAIGFTRSAYLDAPEVQLAITPFAALLGLLFSIGALVLVHNLYSGASQPSREALRWPAAALATMWLYDLNSAALTYFAGQRPGALIELRGGAMIAALVFLAIGLVQKPGSPKFQPSRQVAFQSFSLLAIGAYLLVMMVIVQGLSYTGQLAQVIQVGFLLTAASACLFVLPSRSRRSWLRVTLTKHLFQHRYDYRAEWLRFNDTIGRAGPDARPLYERIVQAVADITDSPGGLLLVEREGGGLELAGRWEWPEIEVPAEAIPAGGARFFETSQFILDLDELRARRAEGIPAVAQPDWLTSQSDAWALVPLVHYDRLVGLVVLARPAVKRRLDWEDFDLLRVVGRQLASYLAEHATQEVLGEAQRFDDFNRRIAFVMHDIKNLVSQLSLLSRNAQRHADKPEFRADMLVTLRSSTEKLEALLARLGRYGTQPVRLQQVDVGALLRDVATRYSARHKVVVLDRPACAVTADAESLEQALIHLVHNAIDASPAGAAVFLDMRCDGAEAVIEVIDAGCGMSAEFVRTALFRPFHSSKPGGFGIGAFEARETIRAMGGALEVESREGLGTRFRISLPLAAAEPTLQPTQSVLTEVA